MKRYLLFGFDRYYPRGGMNDLIQSFNNAKDITLTSTDIWYANFQIFDTVTKEKYGINLEWEMERLSENEEDYSVTDEKRKKILIGFIRGLLK